MVDTIISKKDRESQDWETAQKLKPALGRFVKQEQIKNAERNAKKNKAIADEKLSMETVKMQCVRLSMRAFFDAKLWAKFPSPLEMAWTTGKTMDGRILTQEELEIERNLDLGGFSSFLLDEYYNNRGNIQIGAYLHPLLEKNLEWFWQKFVYDLRTTLAIDRKRKELGNQGVVIVDD